jgi:hypothetical protein
MRNWVTYLGPALSISLLLGCGGATNGYPPVGGTGTGGTGGTSGTGGTGATGGLPGNRKLMTLTEAEATQVCNDLGAYQVHNISQRGLCKFAGITSANLVATIDPTLTDADLQTACNLGVDQCNAYPSDPTTSCPLGEPSTCTPTPTVDDLTKCNVDDVAAVNATMAALPACSQITRAWLNANASTAGMVQTPASCTALHAECPDILAM